MTNHASTTDSVDPAWKSLLAIAGVAAAIMAAFIPVQIGVFITNPPPGSADGWFALLNSNWFIGLLDMDLLLIVDQVLMALVLLALYVLLRKTSPSYMAIALLFGVMGMAGYFASTSAFEMLSLARQYAVAAEAEKPVLLAAGRAVLANWQGTAFSVGYVLEGVALLIVALTMRKSPLFGKVTAWVGIVLGVLSLLPPTAGSVGMVFALGSLIPLEIWDILIARRFLQLARPEVPVVGKATKDLSPRPG